MRIIISPAKKMVTDADSLPCRDMPLFLDKTQILLAELKKMSYEQLKKMWKCNDAIAQENAERIENMRLDQMLTPAVLAYQGIQYKYMAPNVFDKSEIEYINEHLRILSGFYGLLRPFDGVVPYRLEMQAKLKTEYASDLYGFWSDNIAKSLFSQSNCIINLASKEYSSCIKKYAGENIQFITITFAEETNGKLLEKATACTMARGEMVRFMAEEKIINPNEIKKFNRQGYMFSPSHSNEDNYVFIEKI